MSKIIEISKAKEKIASCYACKAQTYDSSLKIEKKAVEVLYEVRINHTCIRLCEECLMDLVTECNKVFANEIK